MMRILLIDNEALGMDFVQRCEADGHRVKWFIRQDEKSKWIGRGNAANIATDYADWVEWADLIVLTDNAKYLTIADNLRRQGKMVISCPVDAAPWELDRQAGMDAFKAAGVDVPPFKVFSDYDKAIAYVKKENRRFVSKPNGDVDRALSYVAKSPADMIFMLERWKKLQKHKAPFILQEFIGGTEMAVGGFFGPGGFMEGWHENWEFKKLMNDDMGVATGEQGTVLRVVRKSKLAEKVLKPMSAMLSALDYVGYIDVNCIIDGEGNPWPLEFTMRFGWPTFNIQQRLLKGDHAEWLLALAEGKDTKPWIMNEIVTGVVLSIPDYPYSKFTRKEVVGIPLYGMTPSMRSSIHMNHMMLGEAPQDTPEGVKPGPSWLTAGDYVLVGSGTGSTVKQSSERAYRTLKKLSMPNSPMYRTDIGKRLKKQLPTLQSQGYAMGMNYQSPVES